MYSSVRVSLPAMMSGQPISSPTRTGWSAWSSTESECSLDNECQVCLCSLDHRVKSMVRSSGSSTVDVQHFLFFFYRTFDQTVGTFNELQTYLQGYVATLDRDDKKRHAR